MSDKILAELPQATADEVAGWLEDHRSLVIETWKNHVAGDPGIRAQVNGSAARRIYDAGLWLSNACEARSLEITEDDQYRFGVLSMRLKDPNEAAARVLNMLSERAHPIGESE